MLAKCETSSTADDSTLTLCSQALVRARECVIETSVIPFLKKKTLKIYGADGGAALAPELLQIFYDHHGKEQENPMNMAQMGTVGELSFPAIPT